MGGSLGQVLDADPPSPSMEIGRKVPDHRRRGQILLDVAKGKKSIAQRNCNHTNKRLCRRCWFHHHCKMEHCPHGEGCCCTLALVKCMNSDHCSKSFNKEGPSRQIGLLEGSCIIFDYCFLGTGRHRPWPWQILLLKRRPVVAPCCASCFTTPLFLIGRWISFFLRHLEGRGSLEAQCKWRGPKWANGCVFLSSV